MKLETYLAILCVMLSTEILQAQKISSPVQHFGFAMGADYQLANYTSMERYFLHVAAESDRVLIQEVGTTEEGRSQYLLIISSPENLKNIERYRQISQRLGRAEGLQDQQARQLAQMGKAILWIDGGTHSNEMVASHQLVETLYQLCNRTDQRLR